MIAIKESALQKSWLTGAVAIAALVTPVLDARLVYGGGEETVRMLRDLLESVFEQWRDAHGTFPESTGGLLGSFNLYEGKTIAECPPYACMDDRWADYADLLAKLTAEQYPPLVELETIANGDNLRDNLPDSIPRLPPEQQHNFRHGMQRIIAALILSEAAAGNVESAAKAHWDLGRIRDENQRRAEEGIRAANKALYPFTMTGIKSHQAYKSRDDYQDRRDCQAKAKTLWDKNPELTKVALKQTPDIAPYVRKYPGANTVGDWLSEIDPRPPEKKRGRKKGNR
jgi:hypothetical protein